MTKAEKIQKFHKVIEENKGILFKVIQIYCKDSQDRKDLEQEILIQIWKSIEKYDEIHKISTWIYRIAMNVSISFYRKNKKPTHLPIESIFIEKKYEETDDANKEKKELLNTFIDQLNKFDKAIILLYLEDYNYKDISEILGITETNVGTKISRIKDKLRKIYSNGTQRI